MMMQSTTTTTELISNASSSVNPTGVIATAEVTDVGTVVTATKVIESELSSGSSSTAEVKSAEDGNVESSSVPKNESTEVAPNADESQTQSSSQVPTNAQEEVTNPNNCASSVAGSTENAASDNAESASKAKVPAQLAKSINNGLKQLTKKQLKARKFFTGVKQFKKAKAVKNSALASIIVKANERIERAAKKSAEPVVDAVSSINAEPVATSESSTNAETAEPIQSQSAEPTESQSTEPAHNAAESNESDDPTLSAPVAGSETNILSNLNADEAKMVDLFANALAQFMVKAMTETNTQPVIIQ